MANSNSKLFQNTTNSISDQTNDINIKIETSEKNINEDQTNNNTTKCQLSIPIIVLSDVYQRVLHHNIFNWYTRNLYLRMLSQFEKS